LIWVSAAVAPAYSVRLPARRRRNRGRRVAFSSRRPTCKPPSVLAALVRLA